LYALEEEWNQDRGASISHQITWWSSGGRSEVSIAQYFAAINTYTYWSHQLPHPSVSWSFIIDFPNYYQFIFMIIFWLLNMTYQMTELKTVISIIIVSFKSSFWNILNHHILVPIRKVMIKILKSMQSESKFELILKPEFN